MSVRTAMTVAELEVWQKTDGSWIWVLLYRPDVNAPAEPIIDSTPHACARAAMNAAEGAVRGWLNRPPPWSL